MIETIPNPLTDVTWPETSYGSRADFLRKSQGLLTDVSQKGYLSRNMEQHKGPYKEGGACHFLPESSQCLSFCRNGEGKDFGTLGINPSAVDSDVTAEHNVLTAFCFAKTFHNHSFLLLGWLTAARELRCTIATRKPEADRATGFCLSSLNGRGQRGRRWFLFAERS